MLIKNYVPPTDSNHLKLLVNKINAAQFESRQNYFLYNALKYNELSCKRQYIIDLVPDLYDYEIITYIDIRNFL